MRIHTHMPRKSMKLDRDQSTISSEARRAWRWCFHSSRIPSFPLILEYNVTTGAFRVVIVERRLWIVLFDDSFCSSEADLPERKTLERKFPASILRNTFSTGSFFPYLFSSWEFGSQKQDMKILLLETKERDLICNLVHDSWFRREPAFEVFFPPITSIIILRLISDILSYKLRILKNPSFECDFVAALLAPVWDGTWDRHDSAAIWAPMHKAWDTESEKLSGSGYKFSMGIRYHLI